MSVKDLKILKNPKKVICIKENKHLTLNRTYDVIKKMKHPAYVLCIYKVVNDKGNEENYFSSCLSENLQHFTKQENLF